MEQKVLHFFINFFYNYLQLTNKYHEFLFLSITGMHKRKIESLHKTLVEDNLKSNLPLAYSQAIEKKVIRFGEACSCCSTKVNTL